MSVAGQARRIWTVMKTQNLPQSGKPRKNVAPYPWSTSTVNLKVDAEIVLPAEGIRRGAGLDIPGNARRQGQVVRGRRKMSVAFTTRAQDLAHDSISGASSTKPLAIGLGCGRDHASIASEDLPFTKLHLKPSQEAIS
jgi:hypothetical protein